MIHRSSQQVGRLIRRIAARTMQAMNPADNEGQDVEGAVEAPPEWKRVPKVPLSDLMVAPDSGKPQGVELSASGWAFVGVSSASAATVAVATAVALRGASAMAGGAPGPMAANEGGQAPLLGSASSGVVASAPLAAPTAAAPTATRVSVPPLVLPPAPASVFAPGVDHVAPAPAAFGGAQALGFASGPQQSAPQAPAAMTGGGVIAAVTASSSVSGARPEIGKGGPLPALPAPGAAVTPSASVAPPAADDMASALAFSAALGAADSAGVRAPVASPAVVSPVRKPEAKPQLLAAATVVRSETVRSIGKGRAAPLVAPAPVRLAALPTVSAARPVAGGPDLVVTGMVLSEDGQGQDVAVVRPRNAPEGVRGKFVSVGDPVGEGGRYVVSAIRPTGVEVRDTLNAPGSQQRTHRLSAYNATQGMRRSAEEQAAPLPHFGGNGGTRVLAAATVAAPAVQTMPALPAAAPVIEAPMAQEPKAAGPAASATVKAAPAAVAAVPKFELHTGKADRGSGSTESPVVLPGRHPELTWKLTGPSGAALTTNADASRSSDDKAVEKSEQVIDFRVLIFSADDDAPSGGAPKSDEGRVVAASTPLFEGRWMVDEPLAPGKSYRWQVFARMADGTLHVSSSGYFRVAMP